MNNTKKAKNQTFSLFYEGFRQLRWIGLIGLTATLLTSVILGMRSDNIQYVASLSADGDSSYETLQMMGKASRVCSSSCLVYLLAVPVMTLFLFRFVNRRSASDFYDSMPHTRGRIYRSYLLSVSAWTALILLCNFAVQVWLLGGVSVQAYTLCYGLAGSLLVLGAFAVGIMGSGNLLANVVAALLLLVGPRVLLDILLGACADMLPILPQTGLASEINHYQIFYNTLFGSANANPLAYYTYTDSYAGSVLYTDSYIGSVLASCKDWGAVAYSALAGVALCVWGGALFARRKSETAGRTAIGQGFHALILVAGTFLIAMNGTVCLLKITLQASETQTVSVIIWYCAALILWILYELLTTKSVRMMLKSFRYFPIMAGLNLLLGIGFTVVYRQVVSFEPEADEIVAVRFVDAFNRYEEPLRGILKEQTYDSQRIRKNTASQLSKAIALMAESHYINSSYSYEMDVMEIEIQTEETTKTRCLLMPHTVIQNEIYEKASQTSVPELHVRDFARKNFSCSMLAPGLSKERMQQLWDCYCEETESIEWPLSNYLGNDYNPEEDLFDYLVTSNRWIEDSISYTAVQDSAGYGYSGDDTEEMRLPITLKTPKTIQLLTGLVNEQYGEFDLNRFVEEGIETDNLTDAGLLMVLYTKNRPYCLFGQYYSWGGSYGSISKTKLRGLVNLLKDHGETEASTDGNMLCIAYRSSLPEDDSDRVGVHWYRLTDEEEAYIWQNFDLPRYFRNEVEDPYYLY